MYIYIYTFIYYYYVCVFVTGIRSFASTDVGPGGFFAHPNGTLNEYTAVGQNSFGSFVPLFFSQRI